MAAEYTLTRTRIRAGQYEGVLTTAARRKTAPKIELTLLGTVIATATVTEEAKVAKTWKVQIKIPAIAITDGVQTFAVREAGATLALDSFAIIAGEALQDDFRSEIALLRAELDILKQAFRQHCNETKA